MEIGTSIIHHFVANCNDLNSTKKDFAKFAFKMYVCNYWLALCGWNNVFVKVLFFGSPTSCAMNALDHGDITWLIVTNKIKHLWPDLQMKVRYIFIIKYLQNIYLMQSW